MMSRAWKKTTFHPGFGMNSPKRYASRYERPAQLAGQDATHPGKPPRRNVTKGQQ
jgi:hypothetical protein